jgi:hypothetical protein
MLIILDNLTKNKQDKTNVLNIKRKNGNEKRICSRKKSKEPDFHN